MIAVNFKRPTGELSQMADGGEPRGAIGVSGATAQQDEEVAKQAISS